MNKQTEIFQNMTKGKWYSCGASTIRVGGLQGRNIAQIEPEQKEANANAIVTAVNHWQNLMSKGINPESVGKWEKLLKKLAKAVEDGKNINFLYGEEIKEALTAAKL